MKNKPNARREGKAQRRANISTLIEEANRYPTYEDSQGRICVRVPQADGRDVEGCPKADYMLAVPYMVTGVVYWNPCGKRLPDGTYKDHYAMVVAYDPSKPGVGPTKIRLQRLVVLARLKEAGVKLPRRGHGPFEVHFRDTSRRYDLSPENLTFRPRTANKHYVSALRARDPSFDFETGFDLPCPVLTALAEGNAA